MSVMFNPFDDPREHRRGMRGRTLIRGVEIRGESHAYDYASMLEQEIETLKKRLNAVELMPSQMAVGSLANKAASGKPAVKSGKRVLLCT